jgi:ketosteroid isomerase-like protein
MSRENVEAARDVIDAFNRRDLDAVLAFADPQVEFNTRFVERGGSYHGHEGVRTWWEDLLRIFPDFSIELDENDLHDLGDVLIGRARVRGHGMGSDTPFEEDVWQVTRWRNGKIVSSYNYGTEAEALEAAGLSE